MVNSSGPTTGGGGGWLSLVVGRLILPNELKRTARTSMRTYPDVADKAARLGTERIESIIRRAKEPATTDTPKASA